MRITHIAIFAIFCDLPNQIALEPSHERQPDPELETLIHDKVSKGGYTSASEIVREALRLMEERDQMQELYKASMREKIAAGMASLRAGQGTDGEAFLAGLDAGLAGIERNGQ